jgi:serine/threonine protein kinase
LKKSFGKKADVWSYGILAHALLTGTLPYDGDDTNEIAKSIVTKSPDYNFRAFKRLSQPAKDFIQCKHNISYVFLVLLVKDPEKRPTIEESLGHPFMTQES